MNRPRSPHRRRSYLTRIPADRQRTQLGADEYIPESHPNSSSCEESTGPANVVLAVSTWNGRRREGARREAGKASPRAGKADARIGRDGLSGCRARPWGCRVYGYANQVTAFTGAIRRHDLSARSAGAIRQRDPPGRAVREQGPRTARRSPSFPGRVGNPGEATDGGPRWLAPGIGRTPGIRRKETSRARTAGGRDGTRGGALRARRSHLRDLGDRPLTHWPARGDRRHISATWGTDAERRAMERTISPVRTAVMDSSDEAIPWLSSVAPWR